MAQHSTTTTAHTEDVAAAVSALTVFAATATGAATETENGRAYFAEVIRIADRLAACVEASAAAADVGFYL